MHDTAPRDPLLAIDEIHGALEEHAAQVRAAAALDPATLDRARLLWLHAYLGRGVLGHFAYEEQHLFPVLRLFGGGGDLGARLALFEAEHHVLRGEIGALLVQLAALTQPDMDLSAATAFLDHAQDLMARLQRHAAMEDATLAPLLTAHGAEIRATMVESAEGRARAEHIARYGARTPGARQGPRDPDRG